MRLTRFLSTSLVLLFALCTIASAQQSASYAYGSFNITLAKQLSYKQPGLGGGVGGSFNITHSFTLRDDFEVVAEHKTFESAGKTIANTAALRWYTPATSNRVMQNKSLFVEGGLETAGHTNLSSVMRLNLGAGIDVLNQTSKMPTLELKIDFVKALKDVHDMNSAKVGAASYYNFPHSAFGMFGAGELSYGRFHDIGSPHERNAIYGEFRFGFFINLSAVAGS